MCCLDDFSRELRSMFKICYFSLSSSVDGNTQQQGVSCSTLCAFKQGLSSG